MTAQRLGLTAVAATILVALLAWLRDPAWLASQRGGLEPAGSDAVVGALNIMSGHAFFFVPADVRSLDIPVRSTLRDDERARTMLRVTVNDRPSAVQAVDGVGWIQVHVDCTAAPDKRRSRRRIDLRVNWTRDDGHAALLLGPVALHRQP